MNGLKSLFNEMRDKLKETGNFMDEQVQAIPHDNNIIVNHVELAHQPSIGLIHKLQRCESGLSED